MPSKFTKQSIGAETIMKTVVIIAATLLTLQMRAQSIITIRYNQVGSYSWQEKFIVVEGINPVGKVNVKMSDGKTLKPKITIGMPRS